MKTRRRLLRQTKKTKKTKKPKKQRGGQGQGQGYNSDQTFQNVQLNEEYPYFPLSVPLGCPTSSSILPYETFEENFERALVFYWCVRNKVPMDYERVALSAVEKESLLGEWRARLQEDPETDPIQVTLERVLFVPPTAESQIDQEIFKFFAQGTPIPAYGCRKRGNPFQGPLARFIRAVLFSPTDIRNISDYATARGNCPAPSDVGRKLPYDLEDLCVHVTANKLVEPFPVGPDRERTSDEILTLLVQPLSDLKIEQDIAGPMGITVIAESFKTTPFLMRLFENQRVLDISPQLAFLFFRDHDECPIGQVACRDLLGAAFSRNFVPFETHTSLKGEVRRVKDQYEMAYFVLCHAIAAAGPPAAAGASFYDEPNQQKAYKIRQFLEANPDFFDHADVRELLEWARLRPREHNAVRWSTKITKVFKPSFSVKSNMLMGYFMNPPLGRLHMTGYGRRASRRRVNHRQRKTRRNLQRR